MTFKISTRYKSPFTSKDLNDRFKTVFGGNCLINGFDVTADSAKKEILIAPGKAIVDGTEISSVDIQKFNVTSTGEWCVVISYKHEDQLVTSSLIKKSELIPSDENFVLVDIVVSENTDLSWSFNITMASKVKSMTDISEGGSGSAITSGRAATRNYMLDSENIIPKSSTEGINHEKVDDGLYKNVLKVTSSANQGAISVADEGILIGEFNPGDKIPVSILAKGTPMVGKEGKVTISIRGKESEELKSLKTGYSQIDAVVDYDPSSANKTEPRWINGEPVPKADVKASITKYSPTPSLIEEREVTTEKFLKANYIKEPVTLMPTRRSALTGQAVNDKIYCIGGTSNNRNLSNPPDLYYDKVEIYNTITDSWSNGTSMPTKRAFLASAVVGNKIYCIGGTNGSYLSTIEVYNTESNTWETVSDLPTRRHGLRCSVVGNKIYCIGGYNGSAGSGYTNVVEVYDIASNTWSTETPMPNDREGFICEAVGDKIYCMGTDSMAKVGIYDTKTGLWSLGQNMSIGQRKHPSGCVIGSRIYCIGGLRGSEFTNTIAYYNTEKDVWTLTSSIIVPRSHTISCLVGDNIYCIGGYNDQLNESGVVSTVEIYSTGSDIIAGYLPSSMPKIISEFACQTVGDNIYCIGGRESEFSYVNSNYVYNSISNTWTSKSPAPFKRASVSTAAHGDKIYCIGGNIFNLDMVQEESTILVDIYDTKTDTWSVGSPMTTPRCAAMTNVVGNKIYCIGGTNYIDISTNVNIKNVDVYNIETNTWSSETPLSDEVYGSSSQTIGDKIYCIGGHWASQTYSNFVKIYDTKTKLWSTGTSMLSGRSFHTTIVHGDYIYCMGGRNLTDGALNITEKYNTLTDKWTTASPVPSRLSGSKAAIVNNRIYCLGGSKVYDDTDILEVYDVINDFWYGEDYKYMPTKRFGLVSVQYNGKIYCIGGKANSNTVTGVVEIYDVNNNRWSTGVAMPTPVQNFQAQVANGAKIYCIGGVASSSVATVQIYDITANSWSTGASMPTSRSSFMSGFSDNKIYCMGGSVPGMISNVTEIYNIVNNTWSTGATLPNTITAGSSQSYLQKIYCIGGQSSLSILNSVYILDTVTNSWSVGAPMSVKRSAFASALINDEIHCIGGYTSSGGSYMATTEKYQIGTNKWIKLSTGPIAAEGLSAEAYNNRVYCFGGKDSRNILNTTEVYQRYDDKWAMHITKRMNTTIKTIVEDGSNSLLPMPTGRFSLEGQVIGNKIYCLGGNGDNNSPKNPSGTLNTIEIYDVENNSWSTGMSMITPREGFASCVIGDKIYCFGGLNGIATDKVEVYDSTNDTWTEIAPMLSKKYEFKGYAMGTKIYCFGGYSSNVLNALEVYDTIANTWSVSSPAPTARRLYVGGLINGKFYCAGGLTSNNARLNSTEIFDISKSTWSTGAVMLEAANQPSSACVGTKVYCIGGNIVDIPGASRSGMLQIYNTETNSWNEGATMPTGRISAATGSVDNKIYCIGGVGSEPATNSRIKTVEFYDIDANAWYTHKKTETEIIRIPISGENSVAIAPLPTNRLGLTSQVAGEKIYCIGGVPGDASGSLDAVEIYDLNTNTWSTGTAMPTARRGLTSQLVNNKIYCIGGYGTVSHSNLVEIYDIPTNTWSVGAPMTTARMSLTSQFVNNKIYCMGGYMNSAVTNVVEIYDTLTNTWSTGTPMTDARRSFTSQLANNKIYCIGGSINPPSSEFISVIDIYNIDTDTWTAGASIITARPGLTSQLINNKIYCIGGEVSSVQKDIVEIYDIQTDTWSSGTSMPTARVSMTSTTINNKVYCIGGYPYDTSNFEIYNPDEDIWYSDLKQYKVIGSLGIEAPISNASSAIALNSDIKIDPSPMPTGRSNLTSSVKDNKIYCMGGVSGDATTSNLLEIYDVITDTWSSGTAMTSAKNLPTSQIVGNKIYCIGGQSSNTVEIYDIENNSWASGTPMTVSGYNLTSQVVEGKIYCIGGYDTAPLNAVRIYDINTDTWSAGTPMPTSKSGVKSALVGSEIYCIGGDSGAASNSVEIYNTVTNTWSTGTSMPTSRSTLDVQIVNNMIYCIGGGSISSPLDVVEIYNIDTDIWSTGAHMPTKRMTMASSVVENKIYCIGGKNTSLNYLNIVEVYDTLTNKWNTITIKDSVYITGGEAGDGYNTSVTKFDTKDGVWSKKAESPVFRKKHATITLNEKIYMIGGENGDGLLDSVEYYNINTGTIFNGPSLPFKLTMSCAVIANEKIMVFGGKLLNEIASKVILSLNPNTNTWEEESYLAKDVIGAKGIVVDNKVYLVGGEDADNVVIYNYETKGWSTGAPMLKTVKRPILVNEGGKIHCFGDGVIQIYDIAEDKWLLSNVSIPTSRSNMYGGKLGDKTFLMGGISPLGVSLANEIYEPGTDFFKINIKGISTIYIARIFIGKGDIKSDWTPAIEDIDKKIDLAKNSVLRNISILSKDWELDAATGFYKNDIIYDKITENDIARVQTSIMDDSKTKTMKSQNQSFNGYIRVYASSPLNDNVTCDIEIVRGR